MKLRKKFYTALGIALLFFILISFIIYRVFVAGNSTNNPQLYLFYFFIFTSLLAILFTLIIVYIFKSIVLKRLEFLNEELLSANINQQLNKKIQLNGNDEVSSIAISLNHILKNVDSYKSQKKDFTNKEKAAEEPIEIPNQSLNENEVDKNSIVRLTHYDSLTSLPNRVFFNEILNKAISHAKRHNKLLAVLFIDFDQFQQINDAYGNEIGDKVLKEMGHRFMKILRAGDIIARLGGDEFIILLNDMDDPKYAGPVAEKILKCCRDEISIDDKKIILQASIGVAIFPNDGTSLEILQKHADLAMYKSKRLGGGLYQFYTQEMDVAAHEHIRLEAALRNAFEKKQFLLYFQPQLSLENGTIKAVEALIRWDHPDLGLLGPEKFIPLAEETGLIMPIGEWAISEACRINKKWQDDGYDPIVVAVNISPKQFRDQDLGKIISQILKENNLKAKYLEIEITETAVMDNIDLAINKLTELHDMGIRVSIDDFGTGYTSISYLKQFPVSVLKIDQTFIKGIPHNQNDLAITSAVISLGHNLGLDVVAEGVETIEQIQYLAENNCDLIQGYFLSRPLPAAKIVLQFSKKGGKKVSIMAN